MLQDLEQVPPGALGAALAIPRPEDGTGEGEEVAVSALRELALDSSNVFAAVEAK